MEVHVVMKPSFGSVQIGGDNKFSQVKIASGFQTVNVSQLKPIKIDPTLTHSGQAADAASVAQAISGSALKFLDSGSGDIVIS